jgi:hypothetical protein
MTRPPRFITFAALLGCLATAGVAELRGRQDTTEHAPARATPTPRTSPTSSSKPPDVKSVVERIQKRIDDEVTKPATARGAAPPQRKAASPGSATTLAPTLPARRIRLSWRVTLAWPEALTQ